MHLFYRKEKRKTTQNKRLQVNWPEILKNVNDLETQFRPDEVRHLESIDQGV